MFRTETADSTTRIDHFFFPLVKSSVRTLGEVKILFGVIHHIWNGLKNFAGLVPKGAWRDGEELSCTMPFIDGSSELLHVSKHAV